MTRLQDILAAHPHPAGSDGDIANACIEACNDCSAVCTVCADACLAEKDVQHQVQCIRLNLDCADICAITGRLMARAGHRDAPTLRLQLEACAQACRACADECARHAKHMKHCRVCAEACLHCEKACKDMALSLVP
jgi:hypothetical protein